jgi:hypothetical protein
MRPQPGPLGALAASGAAFLSTTRVKDRVVLRLCMINFNATLEDVRLVLDNLDELLDE